MIYIYYNSKAVFINLKKIPLKMCVNDEVRVR